MENEIKDPTIQKKISDLVPLIIADGGKTCIYELAKDLGFDTEESKIKIPYLFFSFAKIMIKKSKEIERNNELTRNDVKDNISFIYSKLAEKIKDSMEGDFAIDALLVKKLETLLKTHDTYARFEGMNMPDKHEHTVVSYIDETKLDSEERIKLLMLHEKSKKG